MVEADRMMINNINNWNEIVEILTDKNLTIATMESCTGGGVANEITNISGASAVLQESYITYCNEAKIRQGVPDVLIEQYTVYSPEVAIAMAKAVKEKSDAEIGIGVTGQLGRIDPANSIDKLNVAWYSIIDVDNNVIVEQVEVPDMERKEQKDYIITEIADSLLEILRKE